jgi:hypothetical protein
MRKILFLDHDGVICLADNWGSRGRQETKFDSFDTKALEVLNEVIEQTDCEIVVSSDWRFYATLEELQQLYVDRGILKVPISTTQLQSLGSAMFIEKNRASDIIEWVKENLTKEDRWVAVDDLPMQMYLENNFVHTPYSREGIKQTGVKEKIINMLNR